MAVVEIRSGGQTGGDRGGLLAGKVLGLATGGWVPKGCRTDTGPALDLVTEFGCKEHTSASYPPRTMANVASTDGTVIFGNIASPGCRLTRETCIRLNKPWHHVSRGGEHAQQIEAFRQWVAANNVKVLNVAGNRERTNPGITVWVTEFLVEALDGNT